MICEQGTSLGSASRRGHPSHHGQGAGATGARANHSGQRHVGRVQCRTQRAKSHCHLAAAALGCGLGRGMSPIFLPTPSFCSGRMSGELVAPASRQLPHSPALIPTPQSTPRMPVPCHIPFPPSTQLGFGQKAPQGHAGPLQTPGPSMALAGRGTRDRGARGYEMPRAGARRGVGAAPHLAASWGPWPRGSERPGSPSSSEAPG